VNEPMRVVSQRGGSVRTTRCRMLIGSLVAGSSPLPGGVGSQLGLLVVARTTASVMAVMVLAPASVRPRVAGPPV
jgi:hypothetical protein